MKKRTKQIDEAKEVILPFTINHEPVFTTQGSIDMQGEEEEILVDNLRDQKIRASNEKRAEDVLTAASIFADQTFRAIAPAEIIEAYDKTHTGDAEAREKFASWINATGYQVVQDGLKTIIKVKGREIATAEPPKEVYGPRPKQVALYVMKKINEGN